MSPQVQHGLQKPSHPQARFVLRDDLAYLLPMAVFLIFTQIGVWWPAAYPASYVLKTFLVAFVLFLCRRHYTSIRWNGWWLGALLGVVGIVQWVAMQHWLQRHVSWFQPAEHPFDPTQAFSSPAARWSFIAVRLIGATLLVPVMEELFWRDFLWRTIVAPNDFKLAAVGEWDWKAFLIVPCAFALVHGNWWLTAIVWAFLIGGLLVWTRSLGACIVMHAVTNLLLGLHVLRTHEWYFW